MKNSKFISHLTLSVIAASFLSCERPEIKRRVSDPAPTAPTQVEDEEENKRFLDIKPDLADPKYVIDVRDLESIKSTSLHVMITNRKALSLITSKSWIASDYHAVNGLLTGEKKAKQMIATISCHFVNFIQDTENEKKQSDYTLSEVNLYQMPFRFFVLHLTNPEDKTSKYIACAVPANRILTGIDLVRAFGEELGLFVYLK